MSIPLFRFCFPLAVAGAVAALSGCATTATGSCKAIAGPGWQVLNEAPADASQLLSRQGVSDTRDLIWLRKDGEDGRKIMGCHYASGMIYPGCSGSVGYVFEKQKTGWKSDGVVMDTCDANGVKDDDL